MLEPLAAPGNGEVELGDDDMSRLATHRQGGHDVACG
jgi:hypothetical protein